jgi:hypothetical protein
LGDVRAGGGWGGGEGGVISSDEVELARMGSCADNLDEKKGLMGTAKLILASKKHSSK